MNTILKTTQSEKFREAIDWAVFSLGVLSLSFAVGATVMTKVTHLG